MTKQMMFIILLFSLGNVVYSMQVSPLVMKDMQQEGIPSVIFDENQAQVWEQRADSEIVLQCKVALYQEVFSFYYKAYISCSDPRLQASIARVKNKLTTTVEEISIEHQRRFMLSCDKPQVPVLKSDEQRVLILQTLLQYFSMLRNSSPAFTLRLYNSIGLLYRDLVRLTSGEQYVVYVQKAYDFFLRAAIQGDNEARQNIELFLQEIAHREPDNPKKQVLYTLAQEWQRIRLQEATQKEHITTKRAAPTLESPPVKKSKTSITFLLNEESDAGM